MIKRKENKNNHCIMLYNKTQRRLEEVRQKRDKEEKNQAAQEHNKEEIKADERQK